MSSRDRDKYSRNYAKDTDDERKIQKLRSEIDEIRKRESYYKSHPEEHAQYKRQWTFYWVVRSKELKKQRKDPKIHDFTKEWAVHWNQYIENYYRRKVDEVETEIKKLNKQPEYETISSDSQDEYGRDSRKRFKAESYSCSVSLISVLRVLSALEDDLGINAASKVINLLAISLELERSKPNSSDLILQDAENYSLLELLREKLKGMVSVKLLESRKHEVAKKCIDDITQLLAQIPKPEAITNRQRIADMIEKEVAAHGKTDLTSLELDVLVDVYLEEMEAQKKNPEAIQEVEKESQDDYSLEILTDHDLKVLYHNFEDLDEEKKQLVIDTFKHIEQVDPERNKRLQQLINGKVPMPSPQRPTIDLSDDDDANYDVNEIFDRIKKET